MEDPRLGPITEEEEAQIEKIQEAAFAAGEEPSADKASPAILAKLRGITVGQLLKFDPLPTEEEERRKEWVEEQRGLAKETIRYAAGVTGDMEAQQSRRDLEKGRKTAALKAMRYEPCFHCGSYNFTFAQTSKVKAWGCTDCGLQFEYKGVAAITRTLWSEISARGDQPQENPTASINETCPLCLGEETCKFSVNTYLSEHCVHVACKEFEIEFFGPTSDNPAVAIYYMNSISREARNDNK